MKIVKTVGGDLATGEEGAMIFGKFYQITPKGEMGIYHAGLMDFLGSHGFINGKYNNKYHLLRIENNILSESSVEDAIRFVDDYIRNVLPRELGNGVTSNDLRNLMVRGVQNFFERKKLEFLPNREINTHRDTRHEAFFYYKNCFVSVTAGEITVYPHSELKHLVWKNQIKEREFTKVELNSFESVIEQFLFNVCNKDEERYKSLISLIGYMLHNFKNLSQAKVIVFVDEEIGEMGDANGGTGKSIIAKAIISMKHGVLIPGKNFSIDKTFAFERVTLGTDIIVIDDARQNEKFEMYYNIITEGITVEKKHKGEFFIPFENSPKLAITTNYVLRSPEGNSAERRKIEFEASKFYNKDHQPEKDFGHILFQEWDAAEWNRFDNAMLNFAQAYLRNGIIQPPKINITLRKLINDIGPELVEFLNEKVLSGLLRFHKKNLHDEFVRTYQGLRKYYPSPNKFTNKMKRYFIDNEISFYEYPANTKHYLVINTGNNPEEVDQKTDDPEPKSAPKSIAHHVYQKEESTMLTVKTVQHDYRVIDSAEKRKELIEMLVLQSSISFDTETTGLDPITDNIVGLSISVKPYQAFYIPIPEDYQGAEDILSEFRFVFENEASEKIAHNLKFDLRVLRKYGIKVKGKLFDTMIAHYLCFPDANSHGLKFLTEEFLNYRQVSFEDIVGKGKNKNSILTVPLMQLSEYACEDADYTLQLKLIFEKTLIQHGAEDVFYDIEMPLVSVLADMEHQGVKLDTTYLNNLLNLTDRELAKSSEKMFLLAGEKFNTNAPKQISRILFEKLGIEPGNIPKGKSGNFSTSADSLTKIAFANPVVPLIIKQKELISIRSNFLEKLPRMVNTETGRIHTQYNQAVASTGRLSSKEPNLQNVPKKATGLGSKVRGAFVPNSKDHVIISADYSQVELRIVAHLSEDVSLIEAFRNNQDVHSATAAKIHGVPVEEILKDDPRRKIAKSINFGLNYGMTKYGLANRLTAETGKYVSEAEAQEMIVTYFETFTGVKKYMGDAVFDASTKGYAETLFKRRRELPDINSSDRYKRESASRIAINMPIQGTAADIIKMAMVKLHHDFAQKNMATKMIMQIHDELVFDCHKSEFEQALSVIRSAMENVVQLCVPLLVEIGHGDNWLAAH